jgi:hypothetical protein
MSSPCKKKVTLLTRNSQLEAAHNQQHRGCVTRVTPRVEQELPTFPEHLSSPRFLVGFVLLDLCFLAQTPDLAAPRRIITHTQ